MGGNSPGSRNSNIVSFNIYKTTCVGPAGVKPSSSPVSMDSVVVFPAPLCPSRTVIWLSNMFIVRSFTACRILLPTLNSCQGDEPTVVTNLPCCPTYISCIQMLTLHRCLILIPDTIPDGSSSIYFPFRAFSASSSSSFSFTKVMRGLLHQYEGCGCDTVRTVLVFTVSRLS